MKKISLIYPLLVMGFAFILITGCKKEDDNNDNPSSELTYGSVTDIEGNVYKTIVIGTQTWMAENLKVTKYRNGDVITNITDGTAWENAKTGACSDYDNTLNSTYGKLYNFYSVIDSRNIAPIGWHVPTDAEWATLTEYLGGVMVAADKLKEAGTTHWKSPNTGATNESGFTALPGGFRSYFEGKFYQIGTTGSWWTSSDNGAIMAWNRDVYYNISTETNYSNDKANGYSVRCVKD
jgi:uncharacterized protein (TIGR02145 family)